MATKKDAKDWLNVRCSSADRKRADSIATKLEGRYPVVRRAAVLRRAMLLGLEALEQKPELLLTG